MIQQVMVKKYVQKPDPPYHPVKVGSEAKNPLPTNIPRLEVMDLMGLSWIFADEEEEKVNGIPL